MPLCASVKVSDVRSSSPSSELNPSDPRALYGLAALANYGCDPLPTPARLGLNFNPAPLLPGTPSLPPVWRRSRPRPPSLPFGGDRVHALPPSRAAAVASTIVSTNPHATTQSFSPTLRHSSFVPTTWHVAQKSSTWPYAAAAMEGVQSFLQGLFRRSTL